MVLPFPVAVTNHPPFKGGGGPTAKPHPPIGGRASYKMRPTALWAVPSDRLQKEQPPPCGGAAVAADSG